MMDLSFIILVELFQLHQHFLPVKGAGCYQLTKNLYSFHFQESIMGLKNTSERRSISRSNTLFVSIHSNQSKLKAKQWFHNLKFDKSNVRQSEEEESPFLFIFSLNISSILKFFSLFNHLPCLQSSLSHLPLIQTFMLK